jgi:hypothetical protein
MNLDFFIYLVEALDMYRRIFVIDSTDDAESSVIKELINTHIHEQHLTSNAQDDFIEFDSCRHNDCVYLFTSAVILSKVDLRKCGKEQQLLIWDRLDDYFTNGIHLILFITSNDTVNKTAYSNFYFMVSSVCHEKVPVICVADGCENKIMSKDIQIQSKVVLDVKYVHERSKSIQHLWKAIEKESLKPSIEPNYPNHLNKTHDTNAKEKPTLKTGKSRIHTQVYSSKKMVKDLLDTDIYVCGISLKDIEDWFNLSTIHTTLRYTETHKKIVSYWDDNILFLYNFIDHFLVQIK